MQADTRFITSYIARLAASCTRRQLKTVPRSKVHGSSIAAEVSHATKPCPDPPDTDDQQPVYALQAPQGKGQQLLCMPLLML